MKTRIQLQQMKLSQKQAAEEDLRSLDREHR